MSPIDSSPGRKSVIKAELDAFPGQLDPAAREEKHRCMEASAFAFFRGTAGLYYRDIEAGVIPHPERVDHDRQYKHVDSGDLHPQNVGYFDSRDGEIVLDLNDFDDSYVAPFYWDLIRFVAGAHLMRPEVGFNFSRSEAADVTLTTFLAEYQSTLSAVDGSRAENEVQLTIANLSGFVKEKAADLASRTNLALLKKWTVKAGGARTFDFTNPDLAPTTDLDDAEISAGFPSYLASLGSFHESRPEPYWTIKARARRRNEGLGSIGRKKYYVLIEGPTSEQDDDIILAVKEVGYPAMMASAQSNARSTYDAQFSSHGRRAKTAVKAMLNRSDSHLGYMDTPAASYLVRKVSPFKFTFNADDFRSLSDLRSFVKHSARAAAHGHARADKDYDPAYVSHNVESSVRRAIADWPSAKATMASLGEAYSDQVIADYKLFLDLRAESGV